MANKPGTNRQDDLILRAAGEGIYGLDTDGLTTFVNPAASGMLGFEGDELIGQPMHAVLHHTHPDGSAYPREECPIYAAFKDGEIHSVEGEVFWRRGGSSFPVEYVSTPILEGGKLVGAVVVFRDVSRRKQAEEKLHQALTEVEALKNRLEDENVYLREQIKIEFNCWIVPETRRSSSPCSTTTAPTHRSTPRGSATCVTGSPRH